MTYTQIRREIAKRLGDDDLVKYKGLVSNGFLEAVCQVIKGGECEPEEYPELYKETLLGDTAAYTGTNHLELPSNVLVVIDVISAFPYHTKKITKEEYERMRLEEAFRPALNEIFWYYDNIRMIIIAREDQEVLSAGIVLHYLKNPSPDGWTFNKNLIDDLKYGRNFLYKCIDRATRNIASYPMGRPVAAPEGA